MFQLSINTLTEFLGQIFPELLWDTFWGSRVYLKLKEQHHIGKTLRYESYQYIIVSCESYNVLKLPRILGKYLEHEVVLHPY